MTVLDAYLQRFPLEDLGMRPLRTLILVGAEISQRKEFRGHVTAGGIVLGGSGRILLIHHRVLDRWLLPGGHLEADDQTLEAAAVRETCEETGLRPSDLTRHPGWSAGLPLDINRHPIPANPLKAEPAHDHWDLGFLFRCSNTEVSIQADEVGDYRWALVEEVPESVRVKLNALRIQG